MQLLPSGVCHPEWSRGSHPHYSPNNADKPLPFLFVCSQTANRKPSRALSRSMGSIWRDKQQPLLCLGVLQFVPHVANPAAPGSPRTGKCWYFYLP